MQHTEHFELFYLEYPTITYDSNGTITELKTDKEFCEMLYNSFIRYDENAAKHLLELMRRDWATKQQFGIMHLMPTMWNWLLKHCHAR